MPRPKNNSLLALYKCNGLNQVVCYNEKCDGRVLYKHSANLERHLKLIHPAVYSTYIQKKQFRKFPRKPNFEKRLIDLLRVYPILWHKLAKDRFNEDLTKKTWKEISRKLENSVYRCKSTWDNLIERFISELNQAPPPPPDAEIVDGATTSSWKYFSELLFLRDHVDFTKSTALPLTSEQMEKNKIDYIKEESSESFTLYNETLENSSQLEYGEESMAQDVKEEARLIDEIEESRRQDDKNASGPPVEFDSEGSKIENNTKISMNQYQSEKRHTFDNTDDKDDYEYFDRRHKRKKQIKTKLMMKTDYGDMNFQDSDRMFLLSLLPFLKAIPKSKRLFVRHRIQGVLLEEQQNS